MNARRIPGSGGIVSLFTRHHNAANLLMILMIIFGIFSLGRINTQFFPTVEIKTITVGISWPGASAEDVETNILQIVEPEVRFIDGVDKMTSYAREGSGTIALEFTPETDMKERVGDVESAVKAITNLPEDSDTPTIKNAQFFDRVARIAITGEVPEAALRIYAKRMRDDLISLGIDKVSFAGMRDEELQVDIPERELRRLGLTIAEVSRSIASNSRDRPSGNIEGSVEKQLRALADAETPSKLGGVEVKSFATGEKVLLRDISSIRQSYSDDDPKGFMFGKNAIQLTVQRAASADTLKTAKILDDYLLEIEGKLPPGIEVFKYDVRADRVKERIWLLLSNGLGGLAIVVGVLFIFLNARIAFWVAAGIPVALLATIGFMFVSGQTINMISLFALIMMLGVIVDDAIVVGEHTATRFSEGDGPFEAAENGAGRMVTPVMAAMITTAAAFAPLMLIGDVLGQIIGVLPLVVLAVIFASLIECFLILPGHLAHTLQSRQKRKWSHWRQFFISACIGAFLISFSTRVSGADLPQSLEQWFSQLQIWNATLPRPLYTAILVAVSLAIGTAIEALFYVVRIILGWFGDAIFGRDRPVRNEGWFRRTFDAGFNWFRDKPFNWFTSLAFDFRYVTVAITIGTIMVGAVGLYQSGKVPFVFFPSPESEKLNARLVFNAGIPEGQVITAVRKIEKALIDVEKELGGDEKLIVSAYTSLGSAGRNRGDNLASIAVNLTSSEVRTVRTKEISRAWRRAVPKIAGVKRFSVRESRGGPPGSDIDIRIEGANAATLKAAATEIIPIVSTINGASGVQDDLPYGKPELVMELTPRGAALGFSIDEVGSQVRASFEGIVPRRFAKGDDEITIRVSQISRAKGSAALRNFELRSPQGEFIPLIDVVKLTERQGFSAIQRREGKSSASVEADLDTSVNTTENAVAQLEESNLPAIATKFGISYQYAGKAEERKKAFADLGIGTAIALAVIYITLAWVFASYFKPFAIMLIIPCGAVGAVFGHYMWDTKLTILSMVGLLGLAGILVNDSLILASRLDERLDEGDSLREAAIGASRDRLRAVLLTSLTTIGGLTPLMFEKSLQAQFLLPMAITIVFGLAIATALVLFLVPALIGIGGDIQWALRTIFNRRRQLAADPAE